MDPIQKSLEHHMRYLKDLIENKRQIEDENKFKKYLEGISFYIQKYKFDLSVKIEILSVPCKQCGENIPIAENENSLKLNCGHSCCSHSCLRTLVKTSNQNMADYADTKCRVCNKYIQEELIFESFGGENEFNNVLAEFIDRNAPRFTCLICSTVFKVEDSITLDCDHRFDKECIDSYLTSMINENKIGEEHLRCPECEKPISPPIIKNCIKKPVWDKLVKFGLRNYNPKENDKNILFFRCPGGNCEYFELLMLGIKTFQCPSCELVSCPMCRKPPHPGISCEENIKILNDKDRELLKDLIKKNGFKTCPHCKSICERISGCNFMKCFSPMCKGRKNFCLLCELPLNDNQHYNHYKTEGPFGGTCNALERKKKRIYQ